MHKRINIEIVGIRYCFSSEFSPDDKFNGRIPISRTLQFNNPCFKKRLFVYIFPVIFFSLLLNIFKFLESSVVWSSGGKASET